MLDFPASGAALWALSDRGGPRPEYLLPVLHYESGFNPGIQNQAGAPYYGIGQNSAAAIAAAGTDPQTYLTWPASQQLSRVVTPYFLAYANQLHSGTRTYQAEFLPGTLATVRGLNDVITAAPSKFYEDNKVFDYRHTGAIRLSDLAHAVAVHAATPAVQQAIAATYALRPGERPEDPVYGADFSFWKRLSPPETVLLAVTASTVAVAGAMAFERRLR